MRTPIDGAAAPGRRLGRWPALAFVCGLAGAAASVALGLPVRTEALHAYLVAWLFGATIALGGLFFVLLQYLSRAGWAVALRRLAEQVAGTLPLVALLFVPLALGAAKLYPGTGGGPGGSLPPDKAAYLALGPFLLRSLVYLGCWVGMAWWFRRRSLAQDGNADPRISRRLRALSAPAMILFGLTLTFAAFDWIMALDPHWYSTIYGVYLFGGAAVGIFAVLVLLTAHLEARGLLPAAVGAAHFHDLGKLLFAFMAFWAYIGFSQFLIIWYGNLPEETVWYAQRLHGQWLTWTRILAVGHFVLPFFLLLGQRAKQRPRYLAGVALWLLVMHYLDLYWLVMPALFRDGPHFSLLDLATALAVIGLQLGLLGHLISRRPTVPTGDPRLEESLSLGGH